MNMRFRMKPWSPWVLSVLLVGALVVAQPARHPGIYQAGGGGWAQGDLTLGNGNAVWFDGTAALNGLYFSTTFHLVGAGLVMDGAAAGLTLGAAGPLSGAINTGTAGSGTGITVNNTGYIRPFVHKVTVGFAAMTAAATTDITLWTTATNTRIIRLLAQVQTPFTGGALSSVAVTCGTSAGGNQYLLSNSFFTAQNVWGDAAAEIGAGLLSATVADMGAQAAGVNGAITIQCRFTCGGANCNAATAGSAVFYIDGVAYP